MPFKEVPPRWYTPDMCILGAHGVGLQMAYPQEARFDEGPQ